MRFAVRFFCICLIVMTGAYAGKKAADLYLDKRADRQARLFSQSLMNHSRLTLEMARDILAQANASPYPICSEDDIAYQRRILFSAPDIRDIGRLSDRRLVCSTLLRKRSVLKSPSSPDVRLVNGLYVFSQRELATPGTFGSVIGEGNANLVFSPGAFAGFRTDKYDFTVTLTSQDGTHQALLFSYTSALVAQEQHGDMQAQGNSGYESRYCEPGSGLCVAIRQKSLPASWSQSLVPLAGGILGALAAGLLSAAVLYYRKKSCSLLSRLKKALAKGELTAVYQPIIAIDDGKTVALEALLRWPASPDGSIPPDVFIPVAEEAGIAGRITRYVFDRVITELGPFLAENPRLRVNINVTGHDIHDDELTRYISHTLAQANLQPRQIGLELTERSQVNLDSISDKIASLRTQGYPVYIDDFGAGYSSLSYLGRLGASAVKVDKSFIQSIDSNTAAPNIIPQVIAIASDQALDVVIEGIETEQQLRYLQSFNMPLYGQGWYFARPMTASDVMRNIPNTHNQAKPSSGHTTHPENTSNQTITN
ncbi:EAL domain-containing protein [Brucella intermedia]|uniref:EAL domain-containing protein n=1 Tax=Brucella TaxID=234 RepID=UPI0009463B14|nr:EAL domain-containing protein [Brucella intermedia]